MGECAAGCASDVGCCSSVTSKETELEADLFVHGERADNFGRFVLGNSFGATERLERGGSDQ